MLWLVVVQSTWNHDDLLGSLTNKERFMEFTQSDIIIDRPIHIFGW